MSGISADSMWLAFMPAWVITSRPSPGWRRRIAIAPIECLLSGWIPDSTRCAGMRVLTTCCAGWDCPCGRVRLKPVRLQVPKALGIGLSRTYEAWLVLWFAKILSVHEITIRGSC